MKRLSNYCLLSLSERGIDRKSFSYSWQLADEVVVRSWIGNYDLRWMRFNEISICSGAKSIIHYTTNWNLNSGRRLESRKKKGKRFGRRIKIANHDAKILQSFKDLWSVHEQRYVYSKNEFCTFYLYVRCKMFKNCKRAIRNTRNSYSIHCSLQ